MAAGPRAPQAPGGQGSRPGPGWDCAPQTPRQRASPLESLFLRSGQADSRPTDLGLALALQQFQFLQPAFRWLEENHDKKHPGSQPGIRYPLRGADPNGDVHHRATPPARPPRAGGKDGQQQIADGRTGAHGC